MFSYFHGILLYLLYILYFIFYRLGIIILLVVIFLVIYKLLRFYGIIGGIHTEREDYKTSAWLKHHYYELGWSFQDIADNQGVSMMIVKNWVDKLKNKNLNHHQDLGVKSPIRIT